MHYELLPIEHPYNRCDIRRLSAPLTQDVYVMQLLPQTMWGTLYIEVEGRMLFQRHWRYRQKEPFAGLPSAGFTCELLAFVQVLGDNFADILSGQRGARPVEFIGYDVQLWFRREGATVQLRFDERPAFSRVLAWAPIPIELFVAETHNLLVSLWEDVGRLNPSLASDPLIQASVRTANDVKERFVQGEFGAVQPALKDELTPLRRSAAK